MLKSSLSTWSVIEALESRIAPATFTVTTTADSGPGSLRQAILDANALEGADTIGFDIPGEQLQVISLLSPLPAITDKVSITARTTAGGTTELVRIDGTNAGPAADGLRLESAAANGTEIAGLQIAHFSASGVVLNGTSNVTIVANSVFGNLIDGLHIKGGESNTVYGNAFGASNSIPDSSGNGKNGIVLENSSNNRLAPPDYRLRQSNDYNLISGNGFFGIVIEGGKFNTLALNEISNNGKRADSSNPGGGIAVLNAEGTSIGKALYNEYNPYATFWNEVVTGNTITGNTGHAIFIQASTKTNISGNQVLANTSGNGIHIDGSVDTVFGAFEYRYNVRGSSQKLVGNIISQNSGWGVAVVNMATNTVLRGSSITDNAAGGVLFDHTANSTLGGINTYYSTLLYTPVVTSTDGNIIHSNSAAGVVVKESSGISILGNTHEGTAQPIDLGGDGVTANDPGDADIGTNHLQNAPSLTVSAGKVTSSLDTDSINTQFRIQTYVFESAANRYVLFDTREVTTGADGKATLTIDHQSISAGQKFYATATNLTTNETSEFSVAALVRPQVSIDSPAIIEGNTGTQSLAFTVTLDYATTVPVKVGYRSTDHTAKAGEDYGAVDGFLIFEPGETSKTINVSIFGDSVQEAKEIFYIGITSVENGLPPTFLQATGTILNDDNLPVISIQDLITAEGINSSASRPGYSEVHYTVALSSPSLDPVTVRLSPAGGTATLYSDFDPLSSSAITFAPGTTSTTVTLYIKDDTIREETETIQLHLSDATNATLGNSDAVISIIDNDTWVLQTDAVQIAEGTDGQSVALMTVRLVNPFGEAAHTYAVNVAFNTEDGTANAGSDYVATQGMLTFQPGELEKTISVPILPDSVAEPNESFWIRFSNPFGATLQQTVQAIAILNDDPGVISVAPASITEGHSGQKMMVFSVSLSLPNTAPVSVNFATQDGSAIAGIDFEALSGTLIFAPGETTKTVSVPIYGDRIVEGDETFALKLSGVSGATLSTDAAQGTILEDDPTINIESAQFLEGQSPTSSSRTVYLPVRLTHASDVPVSVDFTTSNGTAEAGTDYIAASGTVVFAPGQTLQLIALQIVGDLDLEPNETFSVLLSNAQGADLGEATGEVTLQTDEPFLSLQGSTLAEGNSGTKSLVFTVTLSLAHSTAVSIDYTTADGTATSGNDYTAVSGTLTFAPGETSKTVLIPILGDMQKEVNETLRLLLSNATGAALVTTEAQGTITNDDVDLVDLGLEISANGRRATWTDGDGDVVTLTSSKKGSLSAQNFTFALDADGLVSLEKLTLDTADGKAAATSLKFSVAKSETGNGLVDVGVIDASGRDLSEVILPGRLGSIVTGDNKLRTPAVGKLVVDSFGLDPQSADAGGATLLSSVIGNIGQFVVKNDFFGAHVSVLNGGVKKVIVGGNLEGTSSSSLSGLHVDKSLKVLEVRGDVRGTDPLHPVEIQMAETFQQISVAGDVIHTDLIAGAIIRQKGVRAGKVAVKGDWTASNLAIGAEAGPDSFFGTEDDVTLQGTPSRIARITIGGSVTGTDAVENASDHFGFIAGRIATFQVGGSKLPLSSKWKDSSEIGSTSDVMLEELSGKTRS